MTYQGIKDIFYNGLWKQNPGVAQLLGLCPLLAISNSVVNALSLGLATTLVMTLSGAAIAPIRQIVPNETRIPVFILIIAVLVTVVQFAMNAYLYSLYVVLGIFIPLIVTNCIVLARIEAFASKNPVLESTLDGIAMGLGLTAVHPAADGGGAREPSAGKPEPSILRRRPAAAAAQLAKIGRNADCPCGSGKKYKKCCGK